MLKELSMRFLGSSYHLYTQVGVRSSEAIECQGRPGCLVHGPYVTLPKGHYELVVCGECKADSKVGFDVHAGSRGVLSSLEVTLHHETNGKISLLGSLAFELDECTTRLETRVWVLQDGSRIVISSIEIYRLQNLNFDSLCKKESSALTVHALPKTLLGASSLGKQDALASSEKYKGVIKKITPATNVYSEVGCFLDQEKILTTGLAGILCKFDIGYLSEGVYDLLLFGECVSNFTDIPYANVIVRHSVEGNIRAFGQVYSSFDSGLDKLISRFEVSLSKPGVYQVEITVGYESVVLLSGFDVFLKNDHKENSTLGSLAEKQLTTLLNEIKRDDGRQNLMLPNVALAFIVKNDQELVLNMLLSVASQVGFVVCVDTGSTDATVNNVLKFLSERRLNHSFSIYEPNPFDFSVVRNYAIDMVPKQFDWILMLDSDEILLPTDIEGLKEMVQSNEHDAWQLARVNWNEFGRIGVAWPDMQQRLFRNNGVIRYSGVVHETLGAFLSLGEAFTGNYPDVCIQHIKELSHLRKNRSIERSILYDSMMRNL